VFPLTSLACLLYLAFSNRLSAAVIMHVNAEAASNAIFQPIHNANFLALPLGIQGRARTLSEGIFYPAGLAIAGALLWSIGVNGATTAAKFVAVAFALVFILNNVGVGVLFLPTLIASVRSGAVPLAELAGRIAALPAAATDRVRELLRSPLPELRLDGIALSRWLGPAHVADDLVALAAHPDPATGRALVGLALADRGPWVRGFVDTALEQDDRSSMIAIQVLLAHRQAPSARQAELVRSANPSVAILARMLVEQAGPDAAFERLAPLLRRPQAASDAVEAIVAARREDHARILIAALPAVPAGQQRQALEFLRLAQTDLPAASWPILGRFTRQRDPRVRSAAMALLGRCRHRAALRMLSRGLVDWSPPVRRHAAEALAAQGDGAVGILRQRLLALTLGSTEAAGALAAIDSKPARHALIDALESLHREARDNTRILARCGAIAHAEPWLKLAICARDHEARLAEIALAVLRGSLQHHVFGHVRDALASNDRRRRANAFEILAALPRSGPVAEAVATLRFLLFEGAFGGHEAEAPERFDAAATLALARRSRSRWVREAARVVAARTAADPEPAPPPDAGMPWSTGAAR
jgi:HEAT repeats